MNRLAGNAAARPAIAGVPLHSRPLIIGAVAALFSLILGVYWLAAVGVGAFFYYLARLVLEAGSDVPVESFILVLASLQWIIGPVLAYAGFSNHYKFHMYVPVDRYMLLAVPAVIFWSIGLYSFRSRKRTAYVAYFAGLTRQIVNRGGYLPLYLIGVGFIFSFLAPRFPPALAFPAFLLSNIKFIGLIYLLFSDRYRHKMAILAAAFLLTFVSSLRGAMFHDLILWSAFIGMYVAYFWRPRVAKKLAVVLLGLLFLFVLQSAKDLYREKIHEGGQRGTLTTFVSTVEERMSLDEQMISGNVERFVIRINQGWIISRIMQRVPAVVPHAEGATVSTAVKASVMPRMLFPDKPIAGGKANYERYTGFLLGQSTSMGISLLGEAYINFGVVGAWFFMLALGLISSFLIHRLFLLALKYPTVWLWLPLILLHFVKAETELLVQLNFLVKSFVLVYLFLWANKRFLGLRL